jgi:hypothetical protein
MSEAAMMGEAEDRAFEIAEDIEIRRFRGQRGSGRGQSRPAIQPGASQACAGEEVSDGFQFVRSPAVLNRIRLTEEI